MGLDMYLERMPRDKKPGDELNEEIGYWRKANQIHNWFVKNVQNGIDDCEYHSEVTKELLKELLATCQVVLNNCELVEGEVNNGYTLIDGIMVPQLENGKYIKDPSVAKRLLPTTSGFFFGGTDYDQWYVEDIRHTIYICKKALETTDFEKEVIYYISSW